MNKDPNAGAVLYAVDMRRLSSFYADVLGFERQSGDDTYVAFRSGAFQLVILQRQLEGRDVTITVPPVRRSDTAFKPVFFVSSIEHVRANAPAFGGQVNDAAREWGFDGHAVCDGVDPEGNVIQLRERRHATA